MMLDRAEGMKKADRGGLPFLLRSKLSEKWAFRR